MGKTYWLLIVLLLPHSGFAKVAQVETENVPLDRLLSNLEAKTLKSPRDGTLLYALGRLHARIYAQSPTSLAVNKADGLPFDGNTPKILPEITKLDATNVHLQKAFYYYSRARSVGYNRILADLGMAWCVELNSPNHAVALPNYRKVFAAAWAKEQSAPSFVTNGSIALETAEYLLKLLDPAHDSAEIADIKNKRGELAKKVQPR